MPSIIDKYINTVKPLNAYQEVTRNIKENLATIALPDLPQSVTAHVIFPDTPIPTNEPMATIERYNLLRTNLRRIWVKTDDKELKHKIATIGAYIKTLDPLNNAIDQYTHTHIITYHLNELLRLLRNEVTYLLLKYEELHTKKKEEDPLEAFSRKLEKKWS